MPNVEKRKPPRPTGLDLREVSRRPDGRVPEEDQFWRPGNISDGTEMRQVRLHRTGQRRRRLVCRGSLTTSTLLIPSCFVSERYSWPSRRRCGLDAADGRTRT